VFPTLAEVLDLPVLRAAAPRVRAGKAALDVPVRWVHVSEQRNPAGTFRGGELVLSTGIDLADLATDLPDYVASLRDAGAVGWSSSSASTCGPCRRRWSKPPARTASP
jgi:PucR family transcriptional regulator, purine catabolism regulatory protein